MFSHTHSLILRHMGYPISNDLYLFDCAVEYSELILYIRVIFRAKVYVLREGYP